MSAKTIKITGWVLTGILALLLAMSAFVKISLGDTGLEMAESLGVTPATLRLIGVVELLSVVLFVIPRTGIVGALLLMAYMGGAIAVHVLRQEPLLLVVLLETLIWVAVALRYPEVHRVLFGRATAVRIAE